MDKRQEVIDAAIVLFSAKGFVATTVDEIAKEAGVAKGSFYKMFESKDELLRHILQQFLNSIYEMTAYVQKLDQLSAKEKIEKHCSLSLDYIFEQRQFFLMISPDRNASAGLCVQSNPNLADLEKKVMNIMKEFLLNVYGEEIDSFVWDIVFIFNSLFKEYALHVVNTDKPIFKKVSRLIAHLLDIVIQEFREKHIEPAITNKLSRMEADQSPGPEDKEKQITELIKSLERKVDSLDTKQEIKQEWKESLHYLKDELKAPKPRLVMIKSLLNYLSQSEELSELCKRIERLLPHP